MKKFEQYYNNYMNELLGEDANSIVPNTNDYNGETSVDVADKLEEELTEHFGNEIKRIDIPSTLSNKIEAFLWSNDNLKISIQISVLKSRIDNDYKITIKNLNDSSADVIDIPDDQLESQINAVIDKLTEIKESAEGPEDTSRENDTRLPDFNAALDSAPNNVEGNTAGLDQQQQSPKAAENASNFNQGLRG